MDILTKLIEFIIDLIVLGTPLFIICLIGVTPILYIFHLQDCEEYPNLYTKEIW